MLLSLQPLSGCKGNNKGDQMFKTHLLHVWETWMILCNKRLLVDLFSHLQFIIKSLAFCEFASINFETCVKLLLVQAILVWQVY